MRRLAMFDKIKYETFKLWNVCVRLGGLCVWWVQDRVSPWGVGGRCPSSCSEWLSFGLWRLPSWYSGWSFGHELQCHWWGLLISLLVCVHSGWLSVSSWCLPRTPLSTPYRESHTPLCLFCSWVLVFTCISSLFRVHIRLKTGFTL